MTTPAPAPHEPVGDADWYTHDRFGMFIHWGLYAMGARHEWQQQEEGTPSEEYADLYFPRFDPDLYDPEQWAEVAANAGMRYLVVVSKHQEGFCLWDSAHTDFKAPNTPAGRDLLRPMLDAYRARGLKTGLYYSLLDWHHPDFTVDIMHPMRSSEDKEQLNKGRDMDRYRQYLKDQITELLTEYGRIDIMWPDFSYTPSDFAAMLTDATTTHVPPAPPGSPHASAKGAADWDAEALLALIRELQQGILVNDRLGLRHGWDIKTPEQMIPKHWPTVDGKRVTWELCQTLTGRWSYARDDSRWKTVEELVATLVEVVGKGGNLLLNVGPTARGEFEPEALERLAGIGTWMRRHSRSIYGCTQTPDDLAAHIPGDMLTTYNPTTNRLYLHLLRWPRQPLVVPGLRDRVAYAQMLHDGSELRRPTDLRVDGLALLYGRAEESDLWLKLPPARPDVTLPVVELFLKS